MFQLLMHTEIKWLFTVKLSNFGTKAKLGLRFLHLRPEFFSCTSLSVFIMESKQDHELNCSLKK